MTDETTPEALIDAAEGLFAVDGIERASLRAVMRKAGADPGAVHYHFGDRRRLAAAVLDRVLAPLNARRLELLAAAEATTHRSADGVIELPVLLDALVRPDVETSMTLAERESGRSRLLGAIYLSPADFVTERVEDHFRPVAQRFMPHLLASLSGLEAELISWRVRWCVFGLLGALLSDQGEALALGTDELTTRIVTTTTAALAAPTTQEGLR